MQGSMLVLRDCTWLPCTRLVVHATEMQRLRPAMHNYLMAYVSIAAKTLDCGVKNASPNPLNRKGSPP